MNRAILEACLPAFIALLVLFFLLWLTVRVSGAKFNFRRLRMLHKCEDGGVQSLAFVLTLPVFIIILQTIVTISQLMIGVMGAHYAAFASARAATVWIPADVPYYEPPNRIQGLRYVVNGPIVSIDADPQSEKYQRIRTAAVMAVAPFGPSRDLGLRPQTPAIQRAVASTQNIYHALVPTATDSRINARINNKLAWADLNTAVYLEWRSAHNGRVGPNVSWGPSYNPVGHPLHQWDPYEVGWQDPITVYVLHRFALLPGPGRWLAKYLVWSKNVPARIRRFIPPNFLQQQADSTDTYTVVIPASATMTNEGLKSTHPFQHGVGGFR